MLHVLRSRLVEIRVTSGEGNNLSPLKHSHNTVVVDEWIGLIVQSLKNIEHPPPAMTLPTEWCLPTWKRLLVFHGIMRFQGLSIKTRVISYATRTI
jgi:hypothetical protein